MTEPYITEHAKARMAERGIVLPILLAVLKHGKTVEEYGKNKRLIELSGVCVVVGAGRVITVFWADEQRPPRRKKEKRKEIKGVYRAGEIITFRRRRRR